MWFLWSKLSSYSSFKETPQRYCGVFSKIQLQFTNTLKGRLHSRFLRKCDLVQSTSQSSIITYVVLSLMVTYISNMLAPRNRLLIFLWSRYILISSDICALSLIVGILTVPSFQGGLRLRVWGGFISTFFQKWLTRKPDLLNCDWFAIAIHNPVYRPKGVQTHKRPWMFKVWSWTEIFTAQENYIVLCFVLGYRTHYFDLQSYK